MQIQRKHKYSELIVIQIIILQSLNAVELDMRIQEEKEKNENLIDKIKMRVK